MITVTNAIDVRCPPEAAFDYLTDLHREPEWNEALTAVHPLTDGELGAGSRFQVTFAGPVGESRIEYLTFERPTEWVTRSASRRLDVRFRGLVTATPDGCRVSLRTELSPRGALHLASPLLGRVMHRNWDRHLQVVRARLEADAAEGCAVLRRLTEIEYFNWCVDQPYNIAVAVRLRGAVTPAAVRAALDALQHRHPLLAVNTAVGADGVPWLDSAGVGRIPMTVRDRASDAEATQVLDRELARPFSMDAPGTDRDPLVRAVLLLGRDPADPTDLVLCAQHVVADGISMFYATRDLLRFLTHPDERPEVLGAAADPAEILPPEVLRRVPRPSWRLRVAHALLRAYQRLRHPVPRAGAESLGISGEAADPPWTAPVHSWQLSPDRTAALLARCRAEGVSVQSALCTAFLPSYTAVNSPVNLRSRLARDVGESVGLFVGSAVVRTTYRPRRDFWSNARAFHRKLRRAMRDPFLVFRFCSSSAPAPSRAPWSATSGRRSRRSSAGSARSRSRTWARSTGPASPRTRTTVCGSSRSTAG